MLTDGFGHGHTRERRLETYGMVADLHVGSAVDIEAYLLEHSLGEAHHPVVVLVGHIYFHACELRIVVAVHALVAEILRELVHAFESADNQSLEIQFVGNTQIQRYVQRIVVCDERTGRCTAGDALKDGSLHLDIAGCIEIGTHGVVHCGAFEEDILHSFVHNQVDIAAAVAKFGVVESVVAHPVLDFYNGEGTQALRQHSELAGMYGDFAGLRTENVAADAHKVAYVEQFLKHHVVEILVFAGADFIAGYIHLYTPFGVLKLHKGSLAHYAACHYTACHRHITCRCVVAEIEANLFAVCVNGKFCRGIRLYAHAAESLEATAADLFLFAEFGWIHMLSAYVCYMMSLPALGRRRHVFAKIRISRVQSQIYLCFAGLKVSRTI